MRTVQYQLPSQDKARSFNDRIIEQYKFTSFIGSVTWKVDSNIIIIRDVANEAEETVIEEIAYEYKGKRITDDQGENYEKL